MMGMTLPSNAFINSFFFFFLWDRSCSIITFSVWVHTFCFCECFCICLNRAMMWTTVHADPEGSRTLRWWVQQQSCGIVANPERSMRKPGRGVLANWSSMIHSAQESSASSHAWLELGTCKVHRKKSFEFVLRTLFNYSAIKILFIKALLQQVRH